MATGPKPATTPLEALERPLLIEQPVINKFWGPGLGGFFGFIAIAYTNWGTKRPVFSGVQKYAIAMGIGAAIGKFLDNYREEYYADREAVFRHYVQLHPEDFPPFPRKKISDVFESWTPIR